MKKRGKTIVITVLVLLIVTVSPILIISFFSNKMQENLSENEGIELDEGGSRAYIYSTPVEAKELILEGNAKNVLTFEHKNIFDVKESADCKERLKRLNERTAPTFEEPVIAYNPFGVSENTFYFYFETSRKLMVRYTITVENSDYNDFSRRVYSGTEDNLSQKHEFSVGGLIPGMTNYIILEVFDLDGDLINHMTYQFDAKKSAVSAPVSIRMKKGNCEESSTNGLYFLCPKDKNAILIYDNSAVLRGEIKTLGISNGQPVIQGRDFFFAASRTKLVRMNQVGEITGVYAIDGYSGFESFAYDGYGNLFVAAVKKKEKSLLRIDVNTGKVAKVRDLDRSLTYPDIMVQSDGKVLLYCNRNGQYIQISGAAGEVSRVTGVSGTEKDWEKTKYQKKKLISIDEQTVRQLADGRWEQKYKEHVIRMEGDKGCFGEYGKDGKNIKSFETGFPIARALKMDLKEYCFY